jgi:hypothetical protein
MSPRVGHRNYPKILRLWNPTDMTIHWKALEENMLMLPSVFWRETIFLILLKKPEMS